MTTRRFLFMFCSQMSEPATPPVQTTQSEALDATRLIQDDLRMLGRLAQAGLNMAIALEHQATGTLPEGAPPVVQGDVGLAYDRVSRSVRMSLLLRSKLLEDLQALEEKAQEGVLPPDTARKARIERVVQRVARVKHGRPVVEQLIRETSERLDDDDVYGDVMTQPISQIVARLCQDLGLEPDWPRLAQEVWAREEIASGAVGWPLQGLAGAADPFRFPPAPPDPPRPKN